MLVLRGIVAFAGITGDIGMVVLAVAFFALMLVGVKLLERV
jgi:hypothetical protein